ncbi:unnamed protein product [Angiostrongylus costaricensis]|uniref:J domain-containing protein n=1 Tax=Angiostrongylus costaricensis TaxID=334426 RepID=A0A158PDB3_ANGCS|nr:unnamed protein product [Angiostrongylus costaricensis]
MKPPLSALYKAHTLIYSPEVAMRKQASGIKNISLLKEQHLRKLFSVNDEEYAHRAEKKKEKKLLAKRNNDEIRRLEQERKENEREKRRLKRDGEKKRKEELEHQKRQEMQKKEMKVQKEVAKKQELESKAAEKAKKEQEVVNKEKENTINAEKLNESEQGVTKERPSQTDKRTAPFSSSEEEVEKKRKKKETKPSDIKDTSTKVADVTASKTTTNEDVYEDGKHAKKKGGKKKKTSESDSGFHNDDRETVVTNDVPHVDVQNIHKPHEKPREVIQVQEETETKMDENESMEFANGDMVHAKDLTCVSEPASHAEMLNLGLVDESSSKTNEHMETNDQHGELAEDHLPSVTISPDLVNPQKVDGEKTPLSIQVEEMPAQIKESEKTTGHTTTSTSPTQFAQNVDKLVAHVYTNIMHSTTGGDPTMKTTEEAQLNVVSEKKSGASTNHRTHITPLPIEQHHFSRPTTPSSRDRLYKLLPKDIIFCSGLIDSYGEDYVAMAADPRNVYKENARGIQRKIRIFKESPHYQTYLRAKKESRPIEDILAEENQT